MPNGEEQLGGVTGRVLRAYLEGFTPIPEEAWKAFFALFLPQRLAKGGYFARQGGRESRIAFLMEGTVRSFVMDGAGSEYNKTLHLPPAFIGAYSSVTTGGENQINVQALEPCLLLVADYYQVERLYNPFPALERFARKQAEAYFAEKERREIELVLLDAEARYALFKKAFPNLENRIPQYHIASYLGITPTQLSRIRAKKR